MTNNGQKLKIKEMILAVKKELVKFLREENALENYIANTSKRYDVLFCKLIGATDVILKFNSIKESFPWGATPEGYDYWKRLHEKFETENKKNIATQFFSCN